MPKALVGALSYPTHFRVQVYDDVLLLWPERLVCATQFEGAGMAKPAAKPI
ncbi:hypothetical protein [Roseomonas marmotae]|uniref:Uncharacterized protein n=1 Tax=Roseomonas marmotae TaxID=2768161 RepID=A0ABS3K8Q0_9PROT|nr:hypothetical protein [Roseomonas marmotae]MBO1073839.1 hypothetical protein [Roseomonas marmotae]QTI78532.1 hypothetical protein IAI58_12720 [Roseomonas marmotae]